MKITGSAVAAVAALFWSASASAQVSNPGFETGDFTSWSTLGGASIVTALGGVTPTQGTSMTLLTNLVSGGAVQLRPFLSHTGPYPDSYSPFFGLPALPGGIFTASGIKQTINVAAGQTLIFDWKMLTNEYDSVGGPYPDAAYFYVNGSAIGTFASSFSNMGQFTTSDSGYKRETNWRTFSFTFLTGGIKTIGISVANIDDDASGTAVLLDNFIVLDGAGNPVPVPVPVPAAVWSGLSVLGVLAISRKLRYRS